MKKHPNHQFRRARAALAGAVTAGLLSVVSIAPASATYEAGLQAYYNGQYLQAIDFWKDFAKAGDVRSMKILGDVYSGTELETDKDAAKPIEVIGVDNVQALMWYTLAATYEFSDFAKPTPEQINAQILADQRAPVIRFRMSSKDVDAAEDLVARTYEAGSGYDLYQLGKLYQKGDGVQKDNVRALQLYALAESRGVGAASGAFQELKPLMNKKEVETALDLASDWQPPLPPEHVGETAQMKEIKRLRQELDEIRMSEALQQVSDIDVELIQRTLNALGFRAGVVDNSLGPSTRAAIRRFQYSLVARDFNLTEAEKQETVTGVLTPRQTIELFSQAAKHDHPMSQYVYGLMHLRGIGVQQNGKEAVHWLSAAADQNLAIAHYALGVVFRDGTTGLNEVQPSEPASARHFARASVLGFKPANEALRRLSFESVRDVN